MADILEPKVKEPITKDNAKIDHRTSVVRNTELLTLIYRYRDVSAKFLDELGCAYVMEMNIVKILD